MKKSLALCFAALTMLAAASSASADDYPSKAIRWLVPYAAGGGSDFLARTVGVPLSERIKQPVLIENKPGGSTAIAAAEVARSPADGYTVLSADNGTMVFNTALYKSLSYNPTTDLAPVTLMGRFPMILVAGPDTDFKDAKDFIAKAKAKEGGFNYASAGAGSPHHLAMELLMVEAGIKMTHAPYRGAAPALQDLVGGQIPVMMVDMAAGSGFINAGKVRPLAVANATRLAQLPDVPTFAEIGLKNVDAAALVGLVVPAATPPATIDTLNKLVVATINDPAVNQKMKDFGIEPVGDTAAEFGALLKSETIRWHKLIKDLGITLE